MTALSLTRQKPTANISISSNIDTNPPRPPDYTYHRADEAEGGSCVPASSGRACLVGNNIAQKRDRRANTTLRQPLQPNDIDHTHDFSSTHESRKPNNSFIRNGWRKGYVSPPSTCSRARAHTHDGRISPERAQRKKFVTCSSDTLFSQERLAVRPVARPAVTPRERRRSPTRQRLVCRYVTTTRFRRRRRQKMLKERARTPALSRVARESLDRRPTCVPSFWPRCDARGAVASSKN